MWHNCTQNSDTEPLCLCPIINVDLTLEQCGDNMIVLIKNVHITVGYGMRTVWRIVVRLCCVICLRISDKLEADSSVWED